MKGFSTIETPLAPRTVRHNLQQFASLGQSLDVIESDHAAISNLLEDISQGMCVRPAQRESSHVEPTDVGAVILLNTKGHLTLVPYRLDDFMEESELIANGGVRLEGDIGPSEWVVFPLRAFRMHWKDALNLPAIDTMPDEILCSLRDHIEIVGTSESC